MRIAKCGIRGSDALCTAAALLLIWSAAIAYAEPTITLSPEKVGPGDIMIVTVQEPGGPVTGTFDGKQIHFNDAGGSARAIVGIDLKRETGTGLLTVSLAGKDLRREVQVTEKKYPVQRLTLPEDMVTLSPENEARVERDQRTMAALWPFESDRFWNGSFLDPLPGKELGTPFGVRRFINKKPKSPHTGVDVTADDGEPVLAPNDGVVVLVDDQFFSGNSVVLDHGQGIYTMFFHLSKVEVRPGQAVLKGGVIARVGATGRATGAHLHWGVRMQGARVDPVQLINLKLE